MTLSTYAKDGIANHLYNGSSLAVPSAWYIQCHTGDPGATGTSNVSTAFASRVEESTGWTASSGGAVSNESAILFSTAGGNETISYVSVWDASTNGNCLGYGALTASKAVTTGDNLNFAIGEIDITFA